VREQHARWVDRASEAAILAGGPGDDELPGWFREGHASLVRVLEAADPDMTCWTFLDAPSSVAFWARRQAHETAIHRVDAEQAAAGAGGRPGEARVRAPVRRRWHRRADHGLPGPGRETRILGRPARRSRDPRR
jgi:hypothetical protein